jgi:hypothetical protein
MAKEIIWRIPLGDTDSLGNSDSPGDVCTVTYTLHRLTGRMTVTVNGEDCELVPSVLEPKAVSETTDVYVLLAGDLSIGDIVYPVDLAEPLEEDGVYTGTLVTETLTPISLLFGK